MREAAFTHEEEAVIWDFYVTKSLSRASSQYRTLEQYRNSSFSRPFNLLVQMLKVAEVEEECVKIVYGKTMNKVLHQLQLASNKIEEFDIFTPRIACLLPYRRSSENNYYLQRNSVYSIMTHVRNALAHGNTYFFDNEFLLLEDKNFEKVITARMLLNQNTLIEWIRIFDAESKFYPEIHV